MLADVPGSRLLTDNHALIERTVRTVARHHRLTADETEELQSSVYFKLIDRDYAVLRAYQGRSSLSTYLTTVVSRVYLDVRASQWGRWRASASARRMGPTAVLLERLMVRDGLPFDQACRTMQMNHGVSESDAELEALRAGLRMRPRRRMVSMESLAQVPAPQPDAILADEDRHRRLLHSLSELPSADREVLRQVYSESHAMVDVARACNVGPKAMYRRLDKLRRRLRSSIQNQPETAWPASA